MILNNRPAAIITVFKDVKKICSQQIKKIEILSREIETIKKGRNVNSRTENISEINIYWMCLKKNGDDGRVSELENKSTEII